MQGFNEWYDISCNIGNNSTLIQITELPNKGVREVTNDIGIMSQHEGADVHEKDLVFRTHLLGRQSLSKECHKFCNTVGISYSHGTLFVEKERQTL